VARAGGPAGPGGASRCPTAGGGGVLAHRAHGHAAAAGHDGRPGEGELVAIEEVLAGLDVSATSDAKGGAVTLQRGRHELVLHHRKSLASVDGDLKLLSAPALLEGGLWLVPVDGLPRLLAPFLERPVDWRAAQRILVVGPVSIPRLTVTTFVSADLARVVFEASETVPFRVQQETGRVTVAVAPRPRGRRGPAVPSGRRDRRVGAVPGRRGERVRGRARTAVQEAQGHRAGVAVPARARAQRRASRAGREAARALPLARTAPVEEEAVRTWSSTPATGARTSGRRAGGDPGEGRLPLDRAQAPGRARERARARGVLTREKDEEVGLDERSAIANNYKADLFVSIHANASRARGAKGSEVYFLSYQASDDESRYTAQMEGAAEPLAGAPPGSDLALILWDMAQPSTSRSRPPSPRGSRRSSRWSPGARDAE